MILLIHLSILVLSALIGILFTQLLIKFFDLPKYLISFGKIDDTNVIYKLMARLTAFACSVALIIFITSEINFLV